MSEASTDIKVEISQFTDGSLCLSCGSDGMESDLVFASGAMYGDPVLEKQKRILEFIASKVNAKGKREMSCVCIIPARGGSRRIPRKNIKLFHGKPIIAYSIETAKKAGIFGRIIVSTDDEEIAEVAKQYGAEVMMRSEEMSRDEVGTQEVAAHALFGLHVKGIEVPDYCCCLYATAPMLSHEMLQEAYRSLKLWNTDYIVPVAKWLRDPGQFYFGRSLAFLCGIQLCGVGTMLFGIDPATECDINTPQDWERSEQMYAALHNIKEKA